MQYRPSLLDHKVTPINKASHSNLLKCIALQLMGDAMLSDWQETREQLVVVFLFWTTGV